MAHAVLHAQQVIRDGRRAWRVTAGSDASNERAEAYFTRQSDMTKAIQATADEGVEAGNKVEVIISDLSGAAEKVVYHANGSVHRTHTSTGAEVVFPRCSAAPVTTKGKKLRAHLLREGAKRGRPPKAKAAAAASLDQ